MGEEWRGGVSEAWRLALEEALVVADALDRADEAAAWSRLEATAKRHGVTVPIGVPKAGTSRLERAWAMAGTLAEPTDTRWIPALVRHFGEAMSGRVGAGPSALRVAEAIGVFAWAAQNPKARLRLREALKVASAQVRRKAESCAEIITQAMAFDSDVPDLGALSMELLRLEGVRMIAEALRDGEVAAEFAYVSRRMARVALNRAAETINAFLTDREMIRFFDNAAVVGRVDDMIVIALRVLDAKVAGEEEATAFVQPADQQALEVFLDALARLADTLTDMAAKMASPKVGTSFFAGLLLQLACVAKFCQRLDHQIRPDKLDVIVGRLERRLGRLAERLGDALAWSDPAGPDRQTLITRVGELAGALTEMGMNEEARRLIAKLG